MVALATAWLLQGTHSHVYIGYSMATTVVPQSCLHWLRHGYYRVPTVMFALATAWLLQWFHSHVCIGYSMATTVVPHSCLHWLQHGYYRVPTVMFASVVQLTFSNVIYLTLCIANWMSETLIPGAIFPSGSLETNSQTNTETDRETHS